MHIEKLLENLTAAIEANTAALTASGKSVAVNITNEASKAEKPASKAEKPATAAKKPAAAPKADEPAADEITYDQVRAKTIETSKAKGREFVAGVLKTFGQHDSAKTLKPENWADYLAALDGAEEMA